MARGTIEKKTYLSIMQGKVVERLGQTDKRADVLDQQKIKEQYPSCNRIREIIKSDSFDKTVFERVDDFVSGMITKIRIKGSDWGDQIVIEMDDGGETFDIQMNIDTSVAMSFMKIAPNIKDPLKEVKIEPRKNSKNGSEWLNIFQDGKILDYFFTKETPNGHPSPPDFAGKVDYDDWSMKQKADYKIYKINRLTFLSDYLINKVAPKFDLERQVELPPSEGFPEPPVPSNPLKSGNSYRREDLPPAELPDVNDDLPY